MMDKTCKTPSVELPNGYEGFDLRKALEIGIERLNVFAKHKVTYNEGTDISLVSMALAYEEGHYDDHKAKPFLEKALIDAGMIVLTNCNCEELGDGDYCMGEACKFYSLRDDLREVYEQYEKDTNCDCFSCILGDEDYDEDLDLDDE